MFKLLEDTELNQISLTGTRSLVLVGLLMKAPRSLEEIRKAFIELKIMEPEHSDDILRIDLNTLRTMGCEISRSSAKTGYKYVLTKHPFSLNITSEEVSLLRKIYKRVKDNCDMALLLKYDELFRKLAFHVMDDEIREEFIRAIKNGNRQELMKAVQKSDALLTATWNMDAVANIIDDIHNEETVPIYYNNEQALRNVIKTAYLSSIDYYVKMEELPAGKGYADIIFRPRHGVNRPALIVELKWNKTKENALNQIKEKRYAKALDDYHGDILLVGINYDAKTKHHTCGIEKM